MGALNIAAAIVAFSTLCLFNVDGYEVVYPFKADSNNNKRELSTKIDGQHRDDVSFVLKRDDGDMVLELKRNIGFHAKKVLMRTFDDHGNPQNEMHSPESCHYSGKIADKDDSYVVLDTCNGLRGSIEDGEKRYSLEPIEGRENDGAHKFYEVENEDEELLKRTLGVNPMPEDFIEVPESGIDAPVADTTSDDEEDVVSQSSLVPDVDPVYAKYPITHNTRYCEMFLVIDNAIYVKYNKNKTLVLSRMLNMIHAVDRSYAAVNVRLVLVAIEIWTDANKIPYVTSGGGQLGQFNTYRRENLLGVIRHDIAHFMSIKGWSGGVIGMAYVGGICQSGYGTAINLWSFTSITGTNVVVAHELGHNFGFPHDGSSCKCLTTRGCFMGGPKSRRPGFSDCNMKVLSDPSRSFQCLNNYPRGSLDNVCGNGIIEGSEECDCGTPELCKKLDSCCEPYSCKLKRSAQCSDFNTPDCCKNCLFKKQGTLCREAQNNCDLPEYCQGNSGTCPADVYMKDGTTCNSKVSIIQASLSRSEKFITFNPTIKARHFRFNPIYWPNTWSCMKMEILTCSPNEDVINVPQPISTRGLYYTASLCLVPDSVDCADSAANDSALIFKRERYGDCNKPNYLFVLEKDGTLRHQCSRKIVCPDSNNYLSLKKECTDGKYERLANFGLRHKTSGGCVEELYGWPRNNQKVKLRWTKNCNGGSDRTKLHFLETDCLLPIGMENGKLPDSAFSASKSDGSHPPKEARLNTGKAWCAPKNSGKKQYVQVDLGQMKTVRHMRVAGTYWNWVSGFKLFYSDDGKNWKGYSSDDDLDKGSSSYCYSGSCSKSLNNQCKDLWDSGAKSADDSCWNKLNTEADGFGTCDPAQNKTCAQEDVLCGQLQCHSSQIEPQHVKYGSVYKSIMLNGTKCSAASITIPGSGNDQVGNGMGMVKFGTKCGDGKICSDYKCKSLSALNIMPCPKVNGTECAGQGTCDNKGNCHCSGGHDPITNCSTVLLAIDGAWGQWTDWSTCTAACNGGMRKRSRFCDAPFPAHGGSDCVGAGYVEEQCNTDACPKAKSCKLLMKRLQDAERPMVDGVYDITMPDGSVMKMLCDMTRDGGGWTLVVASHTNTWNTSDMVREWNKDKPTLWNDYSILKHVDQIKDNYNIDDDHFEYRLEAHSRGRWGGIWSAPITYKFDTFSSAQTDVQLTKKFDDWTLGSKCVANRMPHIINNWLTTQTRVNEWGSITGNNRDYHPAPWMKGELKESKPDNIWYWLREGSYRRPFSCTEIRLRALARGHKPKSGLYEIQSSEGKVLSTICDMNSFGGGWTLVLNKVSSAGWTKETTLARNINKASKSNDYSILSFAKGIANLKAQEEETFQYMLEADGNKRWGGVFEARIKDAMSTCNTNTKMPELLKKFDNWDETKSNLAKTVPYFLDNPSSYFTTEKTASSGEDGVIVSASSSIYIKGSKEKPSFIRMWVRETASKKSCNQIKINGQRKGVVYKNGFYTARKSGADIRTLYCDMTSDKGAWTLLVTSAHGNWSKEQVPSRNEDFPSIINDYSILGIADSIKNISNNATFKYKLDANRFNRWGGKWEAPIEYTFLSKSYKLTGVKLLKQFDTWQYNVWWKSVNNRMPWLGQRKGILTTSGTSDYAWWGTIISDNLEYKPAPWISSEMKEPGVIWYWINEDDCSPDRKPVDGGFSLWSEWTPCSVNCGEGKSTRFRECVAPKHRCGGAPCDPKALTKETKECTGKCLTSAIRSYNSQFCVLPRTGNCTIVDGTQLAWKSGIDKCDLPEAEFIVDLDRGSIIHKCSGKPVCPEGGSTGSGAKIVVSSKCPKMELKRRFTRTIFKTLHFGDKCVHPNNGWPGNNVNLVLWAGCGTERHKTIFYNLENGPVHAKYWDNVNKINSTIKDFLSDVRFPNNPTKTSYLDNFDSPYGIGGNYGLLLWTYFKAPESGMYTFYSSCDDYCQIFLSTTDQEADKKKIIDQKGWASQYQWDKRSDQKSEKIFLNNGNLYYLEGVLFEMGGGDHLSVAVDLPSGVSLKPIPGFYLRGKI